MCLKIAGLRVNNQLDLLQKKFELFQNQWFTLVVSAIIEPAGGPMIARLISHNFEHICCVAFRDEQ